MLSSYRTCTRKRRPKFGKYPNILATFANASYLISAIVVSAKLLRRPLAPTADPSRSEIRKTVRAVCRDISIKDAGHLRRLVEDHPDNCMGWLQLALYKLRHGCTDEPRLILKAGFRACKDSTNTAELVYMARVLSWSKGGAPSWHRLVSSVDSTKSRAMKSCAELVTKILTNELDMYGVEYWNQSQSQLLSDFSGRPVHEKMEGIVSQYRTDRHKFDLPDIPPLIHFVYGLASERQRLGMHHYLAVRSALSTNPGSRIYFHYTLEPTGKWWRHVKELVHKMVRHAELSDFEGRCLQHYAHRADALRLRVLRDYGGIYLDMDTLSLRSWAPYIRSSSFVIAQQDSPSVGTVREGKVYGLCNAAIASAKNSLFVSMWIDSYRFFRSYGRDGLWDEHSVILPANLTDAYSWLVSEGYVSVLGASTMWKPLWYEVDDYLLRPSARTLSDMFPESILLHLWDSGQHTSFASLERYSRWFTVSPFGLEAQKYLKFSHFRGFEPL